MWVVCVLLLSDGVLEPFLRLDPPPHGRVIFPWTEPKKHTQPIWIDSNVIQFIGWHITEWLRSYNIRRTTLGMFYKSAWSPVLPCSAEAADWGSRTQTRSWRHWGGAGLLRSHHAVWRSVQIHQQSKDASNVHYFWLIRRVHHLYSSRVFAFYRCCLFLRQKFINKTPPSTGNMAIKRKCLNFTSYWDFYQRMFTDFIIQHSIC